MAANEQWTKVDVGGKTAKLRVDYFDTPMKQPKAKKGRVADRTGCRPWPVARPLLEHLRTDVIPDLERDLGRPPRVLELGSGVGLLGVGLAMTTDCDVTLTDPDIETNFSDGTSMSTLEWLQRNIELNVASKRARARRLDAGVAAQPVQQPARVVQVARAEAVARYHGHTVLDGEANEAGPPLQEDALAAVDGLDLLVLAAGAQQ